MKRYYFLVVLSTLSLVLSAQIPASWQSRGIGGGGALFSPSINPSNTNEIFMGCDMSELFHTTDQGAHWDEINFNQIQGGHDAHVCFTSNPLVLYSVDYTSTNGIDAVVPSKSIDGGVSWNPLTGNPDNSETTYFIAVNYNNPNQVIIAYYGSIWLSQNGGTAFAQIHTCLDNNAGNHVSGVFFTGSEIYIGTNDGILVSLNGGNSFTTLSTTGIPSTEKILSFAAAKQNNTLRFFCLTGSSVYCGIQLGSDYYSNIRGVYSMDNASGTWTSKLTGININADFGTFIGMAENDINTAYIAGGSSAGNPIVMKTTNAGAQWNHVFMASGNQNIYTGWCGQSGDRSWGYAEAPFGFQVCPSNKDVVAFTDYGFLHLTTNGGTTWYQKYVNSATQNNANSNTPPQKKYQGIGLENTTNWQVMWLDSTHLFAAFSDINGVMSDDAGVSWKFIPNLTQNSVYRLLKHSNGNIYAATSNVHDMYQSTRLADNILDAGKGAVYYSTNNGSSFSLLHDFQHPVVWIASDPNDPNRMYASVIHSTLGGIYTTTNLNLGASSTWTKVTNPPRTEGHPYTIQVLNNGDLLASYAGRRTTQFTASSGVFYSTDHGATWYDRSHANMHYWNMDVVVDPHDNTQSTWYSCVYSGWGSIPQNTGGVYRTTDKGLTWTKISSEYRAMSCTVNPNNPNEMYYTTETNGLWYTSNLTSVSPLFTQVSNYNFREPTRVFYNPYNSKKIWVSSFGNGMKVGSLSPTGIASSKTVKPFSVYPNPASGYIHMNLQSEAGKVFIYDQLGKVLMSVLYSNSNQLTIDVSMLPNGLYSLVVNENMGHAHVSKIIILNNE